MSSLETKVILNKKDENPIGAVIWMHGLGADYNDFVQVVPELNLDSSIKFIFPNAPVIPVTINNGFKMRAWYDILNFNDLNREVDANGIVANVDKINTLIEELIVGGIPANKIIIAGFSQGGVIAYYTALNSKHALGGLLVLSSYLPETSLIKSENLQHRNLLPILICHGTVDPVVKIDYAKNATQYLQSVKLDFTWKEYHMEHSLCYEEIKDIATWMNDIFAKSI
ncbi:MAG: dienelactone hydrolase family protein [Burkholderiales bacterium]|nr:dienelactone hydrolase family protein [Burkholderiales bacterium]